MDEEKTKATVGKLLVDGFDPDGERLQGVAYLVELETYRRSGERLTELSFYRRDRGPYSPELTRVAKELQENDPEGSSGKGRTPPLSDEELRVLNALSRGFSQLPPEEVLHEAKNTNPYLSTEEGASISFSSILTYADKEDALRSLFNRRGWEVATKKEEIGAGKPKIAAPRVR
ncbi:hypothetical protein AKJ41_04830 [candidate division MSBL1 archaeon SCGC-AAA259O05]|uniref:Uncharacterized protein n=1 Tax=candidate division MSBL1 archaeon SCGC-AAA259O05 TaxID=1698271 RepID=A0A133V063_9EURY|nr:hypothetical protein AKJ41_04830 [candidate division MSBL1 archaeon SCGC-AAA259O05]